ncbi:unnamed protein product (macronuclear) [Paramecium tetraurelia]|uniref:Uncharacterized protein n=1 Tax=Paramecium tetraurelia TaxID=5888 RepID=A0E2F0_PARTE|nr:uncharacterized protein GSPATT00022639001 [Paramecium tetraurelia]CAK89467.1 unnamed protein product [Paramecium tetraurelia]|eukprot:XP_001456864.1 hypothetical protein (macronuclear) [Paramecium tetraurelia strain d4-2]
MKNYQNQPTYELENSFSEEHFTIMAFHQINKILITSSLNYAKAFQFKQGSLNTIKLFQTYRRYITNIIFSRRIINFLLDEQILLSQSGLLISYPYQNTNRNQKVIHTPYSVQQYALMMKISFYRRCKLHSNGLASRQLKRRLDGYTHYGQIKVEINQYVVLQIHPSL